MHECRKEPQKVVNSMELLFVVVLFIGVNNASLVAPVVDVERTILYREKEAGMYLALPYVVAQVNP